jgi:hypothetical protein
MMSSQIGRGGFHLPLIFQKDQKHIEQCLSEADIDYMELTKWYLPDEFLNFVMEIGMLSFIDKTYPNPRERNDVPIWFLITCQFLMRLHQAGNYNHLKYLLNAGSVLAKYGFNVGSNHIGFNDKNKKCRKTAVDSDTVRKFFKDTDRYEIRAWYVKDLQRWFQSQRIFDSKGIFILDQSHLVVPDNPNYKEAVKMPVDEHGQLYSSLSRLTKEERHGLIYHPCYALTTLLNVAPNGSTFNVAGYEFGPGNEDELTQARRLLNNICRYSPGLIKELIVDRGYINGEWMDELKSCNDIDTLIPLRNSMDNYRDAIALANYKADWKTFEQQLDASEKVITKTDVALVKDLTLWPNVKNPLYATVIRRSDWNKHTGKYDEDFNVLISTKRYSSPERFLERYRLRTQVEERFRQWKRDWYIGDFPSPHASLIESHVCFTLLTYTLLQFYLRDKKLQDKTQRLISTLRRDESMGKDAVILYSANKYGVLGLYDYTARVAGLEDQPRHQLKKIAETQKKAIVKIQKEAKLNEEI